MNLPPELAEFCLACGKSEPFRFTVADKLDAESHVSELMERPFAIVGRTEGCDVRLNHPEVSRRHAYLQVVAGRMLCCDLTSRTGVFLSGRRISREWVRPGESIRIGPYLLNWTPNDFLVDESFESTGIENHWELDNASEAPATRFVLRCVNARSSSGGPKIRRLRDLVTLVGSHSMCDLRLHHSTVARVHCSIVTTPRGTWVVDLSLQSKTFVNGAPVAYSRLQESDELLIGNFQLVFGREHTDDATQRILSTAPTVESAIVPADLRQLSTATPSQLQAPAGGMDQSQILLTIVNQFTAAQRDLFENTRQMMATMAETFNAAHQRQMDLIREELLQVHELNRELQQLQRDLLMEQRRSAVVPADPVHRASVTGTEALQMPPSPAVESTIGRNDDIVPIAATLEPNRNKDARESSMAAAVSGTVPNDPAGAPVPEEFPSDRIPPSPQPTTNATTTSPANDHDLHGWLNDRISKLEKERTGRWQKIMQMLSRSD